MAPELEEFHEVWARDGLHAALGFLNARTPHRFTGIYRFQGEMLRNELLFDRHDPSIRKGEAVAMKDGYCALLQDVQSPGFLAFADAREERRLEFKPGNPVISYCGVLIRDARGQPFGTLCHYDVRPCEYRASDIPLLQAVAEIIFDSLISKESPPPPRTQRALSG